LLAQGKEGGKLSLRYTLQQFHQDLKSLHTDAWLEHSSSAGQRALQVGDDSKWVVIASSGLQRAAASVGAVACSRRTCQSVPLLLLPF